MAPFNPSLPPEEAPNFSSYMYQGRPVTEPKPDESGKILGDTIGKAISSGSEALDNVFKSSIEHQIYNAVDTQRDQFSKGLNYIKQQTAGMTDDEKSQAAGLNLLPGPNEAAAAAGVTTPDALNKGINTAQRLQAGLSSGKISETYYYGQLSTVAKSLRATYPGYRDYIDQQMERITGVNPANAYVRSLIQDIDKSNTNANAVKNKLIEAGLELSKSGAPDMGAYTSSFINGKMSSDDFMQKINSANADKWKYEHAKGAAEAQSTVIDATDKSNKFAMTPVLNHRMDDLVSNSIGAVFSGGGVHTFDDLFKEAQAQASGTKIIDPAQWSAWDAQMMGLRTRLFNQGMQEASAHQPGKQSMVDLLGGRDEVTKQINDRLAQFDSIHEMITNKDFGSAVFLAKQMTDRKTADEYQLQNDPVVGQDARKLAAVRSLTGSDQVMQSIILNNFLKPDKMDHLAKTMLLNNLSQTPGSTRDGGPHTFDAGINTLRAKLGNDNPNAPDTYWQYFQTVSMIGDPKIPDGVKLNQAKAAFSPQNSNMLSDANLSQGDKYKVFNLFTSPAISKEMVRLGQSDPTFLKNYKDWAEQSFGFQIFSKELEDLKGVGDASWLHLKWNPNQGQLEILNDTGGRMTNSPYMLRTVQTINRLNLGLANMAQVEKATGGDVNAYLLTVLRQSGVDLSKVDGAAQIAKAVATTVPVSGKYQERAPLQQMNPRSQKSVQDLIQ